MTGRHCFVTIGASCAAQDFEVEKPAFQMVALGVALARRRTLLTSPNPLSLLNSLAYNAKNKPIF
jgi:hypothetical protein